MLEKEIKKVKKEQQKYYVSSLLEERLPDRESSIENSNNTLEKSSFSLVKKLIKK